MSADANANALPEMAVAHELGVALEKDKYGRDANERIVELSTEDAESINVEVTAGKWQTYDEALHFVLQRGFAEIKRTRDAAVKLYEQRVLKARRDQWSKLLQSNPSLITNQELLGTMFKELGIIPEKK